MRTNYSCLHTRYEFLHLAEHSTIYMIPYTFTKQPLHIQATFSDGSILRCSGSLISDFTLAISFFFVQLKVKFLFYCHFWNFSWDILRLPWQLTNSAWTYVFPQWHKRLPIMTPAVSDCFTPMCYALHHRGRHCWRDYKHCEVTTLESLLVKIQTLEYLRMVVGGRKGAILRG